MRPVSCQVLVVPAVHDSPPTVPDTAPFESARHWSVEPPPLALATVGAVMPEGLRTVLFVPPETVYVVLVEDRPDTTEAAHAADEFVPDVLVTPVVLVPEPVSATVAVGSALPGTPDQS